MNVFFVGRIGLGLLWFSLAVLSTSLGFTVFCWNFLATNKIKIGEVFRLIPWLTVFDKVLGFCEWIFRWIRLVFYGFGVHLSEKVFEVAVDVYLAPFGGIWFLGNCSQLLVAQKRFRLNIAKDLHKVLFDLVLGGLETKLLFEVLDDFIFCL